MKFEKEVELSIKSKIENLILNEGIDIIESYSASFRETASFVYSLSKNKIINKRIVVPKLTDDSMLEQAVILAHELGHYYVLINKPKWRSKVTLAINLDNPYIKFKNEKLAWEEAKKILIILKVWEIPEVQQVYNYKSIEALKTYKPKGSKSSMFISKSTKYITHLFVSWIRCYIIIGLICLLVVNDIPMPFVNNNDTVKPLIDSEFYTIVNGLFFISIFQAFIIKMVKNINKYS